jgi:hypothetical protein
VVAAVVRRLLVVVVCVLVVRRLSVAVAVDVRLVVAVLAAVFACVVVLRVDPVLVPSTVGLTTAPATSVPPVPPLPVVWGVFVAFPDDVISTAAVAPPAKSRTATPATSARGQTLCRGLPELRASVVESAFPVAASVVSEAEPAALADRVVAGAAEEAVAASIPSAGVASRVSDRTDAPVALPIGNPAVSAP